MFSGIALGWVLRKFPLGFLSWCIMGLIWALLFLLGLEVGSNERLMQALPTLGLEALCITLASVLGSITAAAWLWRWIQKGGLSR